MTNVTDISILTMKIDLNSSIVLIKRFGLLGLGVCALGSKLLKFESEGHEELE